jgi:phosphoenolpyruvate carboxykinase (ATP)
LHEKTLELGQGIEVSTGALAVNTGEYTGRSPQDRYLVKIQLLKTKFGGKSKYSIYLLHLMLFIKKVTSYLSNKELRSRFIRMRRS